MVTSRAKAIGKLESKVRDRANRKNYATVEEIYADIPDLAGARVALYFPAQREQVELVISESFVVAKTKPFPDGGQPRYKKRFSGYSATHYRVRLRESSLVESQKRYAEAPVEIQVASVLMHAWSEVEHDLVYKPSQGELSEDEYRFAAFLEALISEDRPFSREEIKKMLFERGIGEDVGQAGRFMSNLSQFLTKQSNPHLRQLISFEGGSRQGQVKDQYHLLSEHRSLVEQVLRKWRSETTERQLDKANNL